MIPSNMMPAFPFSFDPQKLLNSREQDPGDPFNSQGDNPMVNPRVQATLADFFASDTSKEVYRTINDNKLDTAYAFVFYHTRQIEPLQPKDDESLALTCGKRAVLCAVHCFVLPFFSAGFAIIKVAHGTIQLGTAAYHQFSGAADGKQKAKDYLKDAGIQFAYAGINWFVMITPGPTSLFHAIAPRLLREVDAQVDDLCEKHIRALMDQGADALQEELGAVEALREQRRALAAEGIQTRAPAGVPPYQRPGTLLHCLANLLPSRSPAAPEQRLTGV